MTTKTVRVFENCIQRKQGLALEQNQDGAMVAVPLSDLVPDEVKGQYGTYKITVEFEPTKEVE